MGQTMPNDGDKNDMEPQIAPSQFEPRSIPMFKPLVTPVELQRSYYTSVSKILRQSSVAVRRDRFLQRQMRLDPDVMAPLLSLQLAATGSEWSVNSRDYIADSGIHDSEAIAIANTIRNIPRFHDLMRHLLDAVWYGRSAVNLVFDRVGDRIIIKDWLPIHGDSVVVTEHGKIGLKVGPRYYANDKEGDRLDGYSTTHIGWDSRVLLLDELQRATIVLHTHQPQGADFDEPTEAETSYLGRGLRDMCWYYWMMKQAALQNWATYIERYSMGIRIGNYPMGNDQARNDMEVAMRNLLGDVSALLPKNTDGSDAGFDIKILEPNSGNAEGFARMVEYLSGNIKEIILGQKGTSEAITTGLGSGVSDQHEKTMNRHIKSVSISLADTITREIVSPLYRMNGGDGISPVFSFAIAKTDPRSYMESIKIFTELGGRVSEREARSVFGLVEPFGDEPVLQAAADFGGMPPVDIRPTTQEGSDGEGDQTPVRD